MMRNLHTYLTALLLVSFIIAAPAIQNLDTTVYVPDKRSSPVETIYSPNKFISLAQPITSSAELVLIDTVAKIFQISPANLKITFHQQIELPISGASFDFIKLVDSSNGRSYEISLDANGQAIGGKALQQAEKDLFSSTFGKLHPVLAETLIALSGTDIVKVSIWLNVDNQENLPQRPSLEQLRNMTISAVGLQRAENQSMLAQIHRSAEQPLLDQIPALGGRVIGAAMTAPLVFAELPASAIPQLEALPYVVSIDLLVEGGPEGDIWDQIESATSPQLYIAQQTSKADIVGKRGFNGEGVIAAVVEGGSVEFANPYLDGVCGPDAGCPNIAEHATAVSGILAGNNIGFPGIAPGVGNGLRSANGGGWTLADHQAAASWALGQSAKVMNHGYDLESDGTLHNSDRWIDYLVRNSWVLQVKSAGDRGGGDNHITSPGMGYNVLTVGSFDDKNTLTWDDDSMSTYSSWDENESMREKPEVSAVGCSLSSTNTGLISAGIHSPWYYDQGCSTSFAASIASGAGALLIDRNSNLTDWPEAQKAVLIASALHNIEGNSARSELDGAGALDLAAADLIAANGWFIGLELNGTSFDDSDGYIAMSINLYAGERVRVAMAYDSNPSADYTNDMLEGDLDLYLYDPANAFVGISAAYYDSWEIIEYTPSISGTYTVVVHNTFHSLADDESTYVGVAVWPGHYVLAPDVTQVRDTPSGAWHRYSGDDYRFTGVSNWNAVGLRSAPNNYDLFLHRNSIYGDPADIELLEISINSSGFMDIVLIDGNHAPPVNYYTTVTRYSGYGDYSIQQANSTGFITDGIDGPHIFAVSDLVRAWDVMLTAGERRYYAVRPVSGDADLGIALFKSDPDNPGSYYQALSQNVVYSWNSGAGKPEYINYQSTTTDNLGLVVWNESATSSTIFYLYTDTTAPEGVININAGAAFTNSTAVTLDLVSYDSQTGVAEMRFSNDNTTWWPWEAYTTSKAWNLPGGEGTKTIYVQYRNNAGMVSESFSDTIVLDTTPPSSSASSPASTIEDCIPFSASGTDNLSGIASYEVQYKDDSGGAWWTIVSGNPLSGSICYAPRGHTYYFQSRARDNAGNQEAYPGGDGDTSTMMLFAIFLPLAVR